MCVCTLILTVNTAGLGSKALSEVHTPWFCVVSALMLTTSIDSFPFYFHRRDDGHRTGKKVFFQIQVFKAITCLSHCVFTGQFVKQFLGERLTLLAICRTGKKVLQVFEAFTCLSYCLFTD